MSNINGKILSPVSIRDVKEVLGLQSNDLCALWLSGRVNPWSKYKPVNNTELFYTPQWNEGGAQDPVNDKWKQDANWWKGVGDNMGLNWQLAESNSLANIASYYNGGENRWMINVRRVSAKCHARLSDFAGYNHYAPQPASSYTYTEELYIPSIGNWSVTCAPLVANPNVVDLADRDYIRIPDLSDGAFSHFGFAICSKSGNEYTPICWTTAMVFYGNGQTLLKRGSTYYIVPFYCDTDLSQPLDMTGAIFANRFHSLDNANFITVPYLNIATMHVSETSTINNRKFWTGLEAIQSRGRVFATATVSAKRTPDGTQYTGGPVYNPQVWITKTSFVYGNNPDQGDILAQESWDTFDINAGEERKFYLSTTPPDGTSCKVLFILNGRVVSQTLVMVGGFAQT